MKRIVIILFIMATMGCGQSEEEKVEKRKQADIATINSNLSTYFQNKAKEEPDGIIVDSISVVRLDTLNERRDSLNSLTVYLRKIDMVNEYRELVNKQIKANINMSNLTSSLGMDHSYRSDAKDYLKKAERLTTYAASIVKNAKRLDSLVRSNKLDTTKSTGYLAMVSVYAHGLDMSSKNIDSINILLDKNFMINERLKELSKVDFDKF